MKTEQILSLDSQEGIAKIQDPLHMREINIRKGQKHHPKEISSEPHLAKQQDILQDLSWTTYLKTKDYQTKMYFAAIAGIPNIKHHSAEDMTTPVILLAAENVT